MTVCPADTKASAPAGTSETRFSLVLISFGMPIFISVTRWPIIERERAICDVFSCMDQRGSIINNLTPVYINTAAETPKRAASA
jgi:hypothetical protein